MKESACKHYALPETVGEFSAEIMKNESDEQRYFDSCRCMAEGKTRHRSEVVFIVIINIDKLLFYG